MKVLFTDFKTRYLNHEDLRDLLNKKILNLGLYCNVWPRDDGLEIELIAQGKDERIGAIGYYHDETLDTEGVILDKFIEDVSWMKENYYEDSSEDVLTYLKRKALREPPSKNMEIIHQMLALYTRIGELADTLYSRTANYYFARYSKNLKEADIKILEGFTEEELKNVEEG